jgi:hypothetical protein
MSLVNEIASEASGWCQFGLSGQDTGGDCKPSGSSCVDIGVDDRGSNQKALVKAKDLL